MLTTYWEHGANDAGTFVKCSKCGHKFGSKAFLMADKDTARCPWCNAKMSFDKLDYDRLMREAEVDDR